MRLLDTDILIDLLRKQPDAIAWFGGLTGAIGVPGFAAMELYQGCRNKGEVDDVDRLLAPLDPVADRSGLPPCAGVLSLLPSVAQLGASRCAYRYDGSGAWRHPLHVEHQAFRQRAGIEYRAPILSLMRYL